MPGGPYSMPCCREMLSPPPLGSRAPDTSYSPASRAQKAARLQGLAALLCVSDCSHTVQTLCKKLLPLSMCLTGCCLPRWGKQGRRSGTCPCSGPRGWLADFYGWLQGAGKEKACSLSPPAWLSPPPGLPLRCPDVHRGSLTCCFLY